MYLYDLSCRNDVKQSLLTHPLQADTLIEEDRLRLYALLAGTMVWPSSDADVNVCHQLDWKRCLAIHLW